MGDLCGWTNGNKNGICRANRCGKNGGGKNWSGGPSILQNYENGIILNSAVNTREIKTNDSAGLRLETERGN